VGNNNYYPDHLLRRITYPGGRFLEYGYDAAGRRSSLTDQTGYRLNYGYTANGQLESITTGTGKRLAGYSYDAMQRLSRQTLGNGVYTTYAYDIKGRLTGVASFSADGSDISAYDYLYDVNDRRTRMTSRDGVWDYSYDATGQLTRAIFTSSNAEIPSRDIGYVYDKVGNRVQERVNGATKDYGVNAMNQYSQAGTFSYTYDPDGNLTGKTNGTDTWAYAYNDDNRLIRSSGPDGEKEYIYNGLGHLAAVIADGVRYDYTVDPFGLGNVVAEYDTEGNLATRYTHGLGLVAKDDNFYTFDGNGNTSEMTNAANEIVNFYLYEPFGKTLYE
jgi:YD repeat-containing protein